MKHSFMSRVPQSLALLAQLLVHLFAGDAFSAVQLLQSFTDFLPDLGHTLLAQSFLVFEQPQTSANHLTCGGESTTHNFLVHIALKIWRQRYVHSEVYRCKRLYLGQAQTANPFPREGLLASFLHRVPGC